MHCPNHPDREAAHTCVQCARQFCAQCITEREGRPYCPVCLAGLAQPSPPGPEARPPAAPPSHQPPPPPAAYGAGPAGPTGLAIASMICGILSIVCCCGGYLSLALALVAVGLGIAALSPAQPPHVRQAGYAYAVVGLITGGAAVVIFIVGIIISFMFADVWRGWLERMPRPPRWRP